MSSSIENPKLSFDEPLSLLPKDSGGDTTGLLDQPTRDCLVYKTLNNRRYRYVVSYRGHAHRTPSKSAS
jgi:hypothetical protein